MLGGLVKAVAGLLRGVADLAVGHLGVLVGVVAGRAVVVGRSGAGQATGPDRPVGQGLWTAGGFVNAAWPASRKSMTVAALASR